MLENTFCHIPGVSVRFERMLWENGIQTWDAFVKSGDILAPAGRTRDICRHLLDSMDHVRMPDPGFFAGSLPSRHHWRLFSAFRDSTAYLDIETTGLGGPDDHITTIALYDGKSVFHYVYGENLDDFRDDIKRYDVLVTYNGKCFDLPFIRRTLGVAAPRVHIDLMYVLRALGITGGLKGCEKKLGIDRKELDGVDGYFAVLLWKEYLKSGGREVLDTLLAYNIEDAVNLEVLMVTAYNLNLRDTPFYDDLRLELPERPKIPFMADTGIINQLRERYCYP
ncbi:MAG TPA: ribonuclease H-like domain-containing protein [Geobacteraceae bacterium]|nr:ribonuclease H-like domain-containing protein [Geobacteraceae bacterium]